MLYQNLSNSWLTLLIESIVITLWLGFHGVRPTYSLEEAHNHTRTHTHSCDWGIGCCVCEYVCVCVAKGIIDFGWFLIHSPPRFVRGGVLTELACWNRCVDVCGAACVVFCPLSNPIGHKHTRTHKQTPTHKDHTSCQTRVLSFRFTRLRVCEHVGGSVGEGCWCFDGWPTQSCLKQIKYGGSNR